jgi:hypothetical protein
VKPEALTVAWIPSGRVHTSHLLVDAEYSMPVHPALRVHEDLHAASDDLEDFVK